MTKKLVNISNSPGLGEQHFVCVSSNLVFPFHIWSNSGGGSANSTFHRFIAVAITVTQINSASFCSTFDNLFGSVFSVLYVCVALSKHSIHIRKSVCVQTTSRKETTEGD